MRSQFGSQSSPHDLVKVVRAGVGARRNALRLAPVPLQTSRTMGEPQFHIAPAAGWINDPNGPLHRDGVTHMCEFVSMCPPALVYEDAAGEMKGPPSADADSINMLRIKLIGTGVWSGVMRSARMGFDGSIFLWH